MNTTPVTCKDDNDDTISHATKIFSKLAEFSEKGLFCNMAWCNIKGEIQPTHLFAMSAKYEFMSEHIMTESLVNVKITGPSQAITDVSCDKQLPRGKNKCKFVCEICNENFQMKRLLLSDYKIIHAGVKPFACDICDMFFSYKYILKIHKARHPTKKSHVCAMCPKAFITISGLKRHESVHTDMQKPHQCGTCHKSFVKANQLKEHQSTHTSDQHPSQCNICHKGFIHKSELIRHQITDKDEKHFACPVCKICYKH